MTWDHPRVGGEKEFEFNVLPDKQGSPPRGRGKVHSQLLVVGIVRITPAWAGKRRLPGHVFHGEWDHPRVGGEKMNRQELRAKRPGSPPRRRGKEISSKNWKTLKRITPA